MKRFVLILVAEVGALFFGNKVGLSGRREVARGVVSPGRTEGLIRFEKNSTSTGLGFLERGAGAASMALNVVRGRVAVDSNLIKTSVEGIKQRADTEMRQLSETAAVAAKSNLTGSQLFVLASGAGLRPRQVLGAPSTNRDAKIRNALKRKAPIRRDMVAAATAISDAAYLSNRIPQVTLTKALPAGAKPLLGMADSVAKEKKTDEATKKKTTYSKQKEEADSPLTLALRFFGFFAIIANSISDVIGPDFSLVTKRASSRLSDALRDPTTPRPTTLLDGLQLSEDAILKQIRLAPTPTKGLTGYLISGGAAPPSSQENNDRLLLPQEADASV